MAKNLVKVFGLLVFFVSGFECANILGICHFPSPSHFFLASKLLKELATRGHHVTMLSPYTLKEPVANYTEIVLPYILDIKEEMLQQTLQSQKASMISKSSALMEAALRMAEVAVDNPPVQHLLNSDTHFDLVIIVWAASEPLLGIAHHFGAPVIALSTLGSNPMTNYVSSNPSPYAYLPHIMLPFTERMSFLQRTVNTVFSVAGDVLMQYFLYYHQEPVLKRHFPDSPGMEALVKNISLILLNSHVSMEAPRPLVPSMIPVGGLHIEEPKKLPEDLQQFLDDAKEGAIVFCLGSNIRSSDIDQEKLHTILRVFEVLPNKVLWKWEDEKLPAVPKNVKIVKWLPQNDVLAHPNVKLFITHGGLFSIMEAVYHGVPLIGIPFFGDQKANLVACVSGGYGLMIHFEKLTILAFRQAIHEVLVNPKYATNAKLKSSLLRDRPLKPMDTAIFWVEHVLRYGGAPHLRTAAVDLAWYQNLLLDVIAFLLGILLSLCGVMYLSFKVSVKCFQLLKAKFRTKKNTTKAKTN